VVIAVIVVMAVIAAMVMIPGGVRRPYGALQWVVADPVAEPMARSGRLPATSSGQLQAVCDKWKIRLSAVTYQRPAGDYADYKGKGYWWCVEPERV